MRNLFSDVSFGVPQQVEVHPHPLPLAAMLP